MRPKAQGSDDEGVAARANARVMAITAAIAATAAVAAVAAAMASCQVLAG